MKHGAKQTCSIEGCTKFVQKEGKCARHGAKGKTCTHEGCTKLAQKGGVCWTHGAKNTKKTAKKKLCSFEGCSKAAQKGGLCRGHGKENEQTTMTTATTKPEEEDDVKQPSTDTEIVTI